MVRELNRKERRLIIRILRIILICLGGILVFMILLTAYLFLDRDNISRKVLLSANNYTHGELSFESLAFNPFRQFPDMSMLVKGVEFYENPVDERNQNEKPVAKIGKVYAALNVKELISGHVYISEVILENGIINMVQYPDSSLNILNSIELIDMQGEKLPGKPEEPEDTLIIEGSLPDNQEDSLTANSSEFEFNIEQVFFKNISFDYENRVDGNHAFIEIDDLESSLEYTSEAIQSRLETDIKLGKLELGSIKKTKSTNLHIETAFVLSRNDLSLVLDPSLLVLDKSILNVKGEMNFSGEGSLNLVIDGSDQDFSFFSIFMSETGMDNMEEGDLYFRGTVKNENLRGMPRIDLAFGLEKVRILVPRTAKYINDLNLSGSFNSGTRPDLSTALLKLDTIFAELPEGFVRGSLSARNFTAPELNVNLQLKADFSGFDQVFDLPFMDSLEGNAEVMILGEGAKYYPVERVIIANDFQFNLEFHNAEVNFPGIMSIRKIDGSIQHDEGITSFHDLSAEVDDSDFFINGLIRNTFYIPFKADTIITAELEIQSELFDLPGFLEFVPVVRQAFPYRIKDINLGVSVTTSTERFLDMQPNPSMTFDIKHLSAEIEDFLPAVSMSQGLFELHHKEGRVWLDFNDFKINIVDSDLDVDLEFNSPDQRRSYMVMNVGVENLNPARLIWDEETDTIPEFLDGLLSGSFRLDLHFPHDSIQTLKKIDLKEADLLFINAKDTIQTNSLHILAEDIYIEDAENANPFASLTADMIMGSDKSQLNSLSWVGFDFTVEARNGVYKVNPGKSRFFGKEGKGSYTLDPFSESPNYHIKYQVDQYNVRDLMGNFMEDSLILGKMDIDMDLSLVVPEDENIIRGLNGKLQVKGKDLILYGIELDKLIKKFERSQNFNLVDLGAVMFLGPAGLAISKGGSYAGILVSDYSANSPIREIVSELQIENGRVQLNDLAFSTEENRVAARGWIDIPGDSLDATIAVVDKNGCRIIEQKLFGSLKAPEKSNIRFLETIIAPVTNLWQSAVGKDCEVFYNGSVSHPEKKNK